MNKQIGIALMLIGFALLVLNLTLKQIPFLSTLPMLWKILIPFILIIAGAFLAKTKKQSKSEVPIFQGKKVVGYRREK